MTAVRETPDFATVATGTLMSYETAQGIIAPYGEPGEFYIKNFHDSPSIIQFLGKVSGEEIDNPDALTTLAGTIATQYALGVNRMMLIHGAGKGIDRAMTARGIPIEKIDGKRVTDGRTLGVVHQIYNEANETLATALESFGLPVERVTQGLFHGRQLTEVPELGLVAEVQDVNQLKIERAMRQGKILVGTCLDVSPFGRPRFNINADSALRKMFEFEPHRTAALTATGGIKRHLSDASPMPFLTIEDAQELIDAGIITDGMRVKTEEAISVVTTNPKQKFVITSSANLLKEELDPHGAGTQIAVAEEIDEFPSVSFVKEDIIRGIINDAFAPKGGRLVDDYFVTAAECQARLRITARREDGLLIDFPGFFDDVDYIDKVAVRPDMQGRGHADRLRRNLTAGGGKWVLRTHDDAAGHYRNDPSVVEYSNGAWTAFGHGVSSADLEAMSRKMFALKPTIVYPDAA